ncbi:uncharacterized protein LOC121381660 [Gigantopelta aegis]|uniref:uncharacterized protein LOC121381660 n=1 Tax=Gigantopelta aegis TaxID=1735272 RepID=UPI001B88A26E|nr:uncharacterized protein LOC121381660 [Gigantopelta aegis]
MNALCILIALAGVIHTITADTCDVCTTTYASEKTAGGSDNALLCTAVKKYAQCLAVASGAGCASGANVPATQFAGTIATDAGALTSCTFDALCSGCQMTYQTAKLARSSSKAVNDCKEAFTYAGCVADSTTTFKACDGVTTQAALTITAQAAAIADCSVCGTEALKSSVVILVAGLFLSYLKF